MPQFTTQSILQSTAQAVAEGPVIFGTMANGMLALGIAMMLAILLRRYAKFYNKLKRQSRNANKVGHKAKKPGRQEEQMANMFDRASPLLDAPATVVRWQVEMQDLARELKAEVDTKLCVLQVLIQRSNEAADRLEAAASRAERLGCLPRETEEVAGTVEALAERAAANRSTPPIPPHAEQVYAMADSGENVTDIADRIGLPIGEVEFVLSLRSQAGKST